jgi:hypothetical protein
MESMFIALKEDTKLELVRHRKENITWCCIDSNKPIYRNQNRKNLIVFAETILLASQNFLKEN